MFIYPPFMKWRDWVTVRCSLGSCRMCVIDGRGASPEYKYIASAEPLSSTRRTFEKQHAAFNIRLGDSR